MKLKIVKIEFCVELDVTNIEFHACFAVVAGANVTFLIKNSMSNSVLEKMSFVQFFFKVKLGIIGIKFFANLKKKIIIKSCKKNETNILVSFVLLERAV